MRKGRGGRKSFYDFCPDRMSRLLHEKLRIKKKSWHLGRRERVGKDQKTNRYAESTPYSGGKTEQKNGRGKRYNRE